MAAARATAAAACSALWANRKSLAVRALRASALRSSVRASRCSSDGPAKAVDSAAEETQEGEAVVKWAMVGMDLVDMVVDDAADWARWAAVGCT